MRELFHTYGTNEIAAWEVEFAEGPVFWIDTTSRRLARKLKKREDAVELGLRGHNDFRPRFEPRCDWRKIKRIVDNYILSASDTKSGVAEPVEASPAAPRVTTAGGASQRVIGDADTTKHQRPVARI